MEQEIVKVFNKINNTFSIICATLTSILGVEWILFAGYLVLNVIDYFTGTLKAKINKVENSNKGIIGILKKFSYWLLIGVTFFMSFLLMKLGQKINIDIDFVMLFGWFTLACLIINECRSIIENLIEIGIEVPSFLKKGLEIYYNKIERKVNDLTETEKKENTQ